MQLFTWAYPNVIPKYIVIACSVQSIVRDARNMVAAKNAIIMGLPYIFSGVSHTKTGNRKIYGILDDDEC